MTMYKTLLAASLGLALAACAGEQQTANTAADAPAAGEMPQAGDEGIVTGSPEESLVDSNPDLGTSPDLGTTSADAGAMGDTGELGTEPAGSAAGTVDPTLDPAQQVDPALQDATTEPEPVTPPVQ